MSDILKTILQTKYEEVQLASQQHSLAQRRREAEAKTQPTQGFVKAIRKQLAHAKPAVIAEIKKASPSKGIIRPDFQPAQIAQDYAAHGATCLSVLTDQTYFQGQPDDLQQARQACSLPILRKDFIVDEYQIYEARLMGADAILLIAAALDAQKMHDLESVAIACGLDVLVEVHNALELEQALTLTTPLLGINNRNLRTFSVDLNRTLQLLPNISPDKIVVTESGIATPEAVKIMCDHHVNTFLVGEAFMRETHPGKALARLFFTD